MLCLAGLCACGGGNVASELAKPPEYAPEGQTKCQVKASQTKPLIVEWPSADRAELESRVTERTVVVVSYDGCEMRLLPHCKAPGQYAYKAVTPKNDTVTIKDEDELYASIPIYAAKFEGKLAKSGQLNVAMTMVGRYETDRIELSANDLVGRCDGATHIIAGLTAGAFEFFAGADAEVGGGVHVMDAGVGATSRATRETLTSDGDKEACAEASAGDPTPPDGCGALLRVDVLPLKKARKQKSGNCKPGEVAKCTTRCNEGDARSCNSLGFIHSKGRGVTKDDAKAVMLYRKACDGGHANGCDNLGFMYSKGRGVTKDEAKAVDFYRKACDGGHASGCDSLGFRIQNGRGTEKNEAEAVKLYRKACDGGSAMGCNNLGFMYANGRSITKDHAKAAELYGKSCDNGTALGCNNLARMFASGHGVAKDEAKALKLFDKACERGKGSACDRAKGLRAK